MQENPRPIQFDENDQKLFNLVLSTLKDKLKKEYRKKVLKNKENQFSNIKFTLQGEMIRTLGFGEHPNILKYKKKLRKERAKLKALGKPLPPYPKMPSEVSKWKGIRVERPFKIEFTTDKSKSLTASTNFSGSMRKPSKWTSGSWKRLSDAQGGEYKQEGVLRIRAPRFKLKSLMYYISDHNDVLFKNNIFKQVERGLRRLFFHELAHAKDVKNTRPEDSLYALAQGRSYVDYFRDPTNKETKAHLAEYNETLDFIKQDPQLLDDLKTDLRTEPFEESVKKIFNVISERNPLKHLLVDSDLLAPFLVRMIELKERIKTNSLAVRTLEKDLKDKKDFLKELRKEKRIVQKSGSPDLISRVSKKITDTQAQIKEIKQAPNQLKRDLATLKKIKLGTFTGWKDDLRGVRFRKSGELGQALWRGKFRDKYYRLGYLADSSVKELKKYLSNVTEAYPVVLRAIYQMLEEKDMLPQKAAPKPKARLLRQAKAFDLSERRIIKALNARFKSL